jgi:hypothetical protein
MYSNVVKSQQNGFVTELKPGDKVRVDDTSLFKKQLKVCGVMRYT